MFPRWPAERFAGVHRFLYRPRWAVTQGGIGTFSGTISVPLTRKVLVLVKVLHWVLRLLATAPVPLITDTHRTMRLVALLAMTLLLMLACRKSQ